MNSAWVQWQSKMENTFLGVFITATILTLSVEILGYQPDNLQEGDVRLVGGENGIEGRAEIFHDGEWVSICFSAGEDHEWELPEGDAFCKHLGFTRGAALVLNGEQTEDNFGLGNGNTFLTNVDCVEGTDYRGLLSCSNVKWGSSCNNNLGFAGVVCRLPGYVGCFRYDHPGFLLDHEITADLMTLEKCLDGCNNFPGPFKYTGVRQGDCNCGAEDVLLPSAREDDYQCYEPCPGDESQSCGAYLRTAIYDLEVMRDGHMEPHIIWPSWERNYHAGDDGRLWRVDIVGYDYAVLHLLSFDLADDDSVIFRSEARQYGSTLSGSLDLDLPFRWVTNTATWFEVETQVRPGSPGDKGFILYYEFGLHCFASYLPDVEGGHWDLSRGGVYYERQCPYPICEEGYEPYSSAICQLDGYWVGNATCSKIPTTKRPLFPVTQSTTPEPPTTIEATTPPPPPVTPPPTPPATQPPPPETQPPPPVTTEAPPSSPQPVRTTPRAPPTAPPSAECYLPSINQEEGVLIGTAGRAVFYEGFVISHCCTHKVSDCVDMICQPSGRWTNEFYLDRCPAAVCTLPETDENGSLSGTNGKTYFENGDEISLCCIFSDYCFVLTCLTDGSWRNEEELFLCPVPPQREEKNTLPVWVIVVIIIAAVLVLTIIVICLCVYFCWPERQYEDKRALTYRPHKKRAYRCDPYSIEPRDGYRNPPPPRHLRDDSHHRSPSPSRRHHSSSRKAPVVLNVSVDRPKDCRDYAQYGAHPIIITGSKYSHMKEHRGYDYDCRDHRDHHNHSDRDHHEYRDYRDHRDRRDHRDKRDRRDHRAQSDGRDHRDRHRRSGKSRTHREEDEASALGALNNVVRDLEDSGSNSDGSASS